jgi:hypothetical protein
MCIASTGSAPSLLAQTAVVPQTIDVTADARVLPRGTFRFRQLISWTRYDALYGAAGSGSDATPLGGAFSDAALGTSALPGLAPTQSAIAALAAQPAFALSVGRLTTTADSRIATAPLVGEYGLTSKLTIGVMVPLVETRTTVLTQLNPIGSTSANVGINPARFGGAPAQQNAALVTGFNQAAIALRALMDQCAAGAADSRCTYLEANAGAAQTLTQSSATFATGLQSLYGTASGGGMYFVPLATSDVQTTITARITDFAQQYEQFLGSSSPLVASVPAGALGPAAVQQLQDSLLVANGRDPVGTASRTSIGDIEIAAAYQVLNSFSDDTNSARGGLAYRLTFDGAYRIATGQPPAPNRLFDLGTGYGQPGVRAGVATDVRFGSRLSLTGTGAYTVQLGTVSTARVANPGDAPLPISTSVAGSYSNGNTLALHLVPRVRLAGFWNLEGQFLLRHVGADRYTGFEASAASPGLASASEQAVGFGFSYSTVSSNARNAGRIPLEMSFTHLETIAGSGGPIPQSFRDQIALRVYLP